MAGFCPSCKTPVLSPIAEAVGITVISGIDRHGLTYKCPSCQTVLGCEIDPIALRSEIVQQVVDELFKRLRQGP